MTICASVNASLTLDNTTMTMDATGTTNSPHAIYFCNNNKLNIENGSVLTIKNYANDALEWDGGDGGYNVNITDSTFISDHNRSGFTGTFYATITNSNVQVINSTGNGSNGSHFVISDSVVDFSNNGSHGLSAGKLSVTNSTITANNNGMCGVIFTGAGTFVNSNITITGSKGTSYWNAGMRLYTSSATATIDKDTKLTITDNEVTGLFLDSGSKLTIEDGAQVLITRNNAAQDNCSTYQALAQKGGGIVVRGTASATLSASTEVYNNHAALAGDDIYVETADGTITFAETGSSWVLDDCNDYIDGWYDDAEGTRWEAHADDTNDNYIVEVDAGTLTGVYALKAAHGVDAVGKTSLPGMEKVIVTDNGEVTEDSVAAGDTVDFKLTSNVPDDLTNYIIPDVDEPEINTLADVPVEDRGSYVVTIHDQMDDSLILDPESIVVKIGDTELALLDEYTIDYDVTHTDDSVCDFEIKIDLVQLYAMGAITDEDIENATPIVVTYSATLSENATAGDYTNTAWVTYPNGEGSPVVVTVKTYGITIFKYDQANSEKGLPGAVFQLYQKNADGNVIEGSVVELTSGSDGYAKAEGLDEGTYYLKETQAPDGYVASDTELKVEIPTQAGTDNMVSVQFANSLIPHTGGMGTTMFTLGGAAILAAAGALFVVSRRKETR